MEYISLAEKVSSLMIDIERLAKSLSAFIPFVDPSIPFMPVVTLCTLHDIVMIPGYADEPLIEVRYAMDRLRSVIRYPVNLRGGDGTRPKNLN
ncbi:MAG TPA: hypothetical protein VNV62_01675 [Trebonia sp.]|jgi:hypothetical protein|nr:hypothetical protein [Trebonia sp.]